jgi:transposase
MSEPTTAPTPASGPPRSRAATRQTWVDRLARFPHSGLSPAQFCAHEGVSLPSFYSWKRRLSAGGSGSDTEPVDGPDPGPRLLPVRLSPAPAPVELVLPTGAVLRIGPDCDLTFVRSLVEALGDTSC